MFVSKYEKEFSQYYELRSAILSDSARKHELCYLNALINTLQTIFKPMKMFCLNRSCVDGYRPCRENPFQ